MDIDVKNTEQILVYVDTLITRAGGQIESFFPYLVKQQYVDFIISTVLVALMGIVSVVLLWLSNSNSRSDSRVGDMEGGLLTVGFIMLLITGVSLIPWIYSFGCMLNPEYHATIKLLSLIKP